MTDIIQLRGGQTTLDRRLDRLVQFDERSRGFNINELDLGPIRGRTWPCYARLDQMAEGACVGFSFTHEAAAVPKVVRGLNYLFARGVYKEAQTLDPWPGEDYEGTSVLAGAKVMQLRKMLIQYRWAFNIDDLLRSLSTVGPAVLGIPWLEGMFYPDADGRLRVEGEIMGGHAILARGILTAFRTSKGQKLTAVRFRNSWGPNWGEFGDCYIEASDLERLLKMQGEACIPVQRKVPT